MMSAMKICSMLLLAASTEGSGLNSCKCLGTKKKYLCSTAGAKEPCIKTVDCSHAWAPSGKCVNATNEKLKITAYPEDYGNSCKKHLEPGSADCYNHSASPPVEKTAGKATWCDDPWCYVDECACDDGNQAWSYWFKPVKIAYSYATCGSADKFAATQEVKTGLSKCANASDVPKGAHKKPAADATKKDTGKNDTTTKDTTEKDTSKKDTTNVTTTKKSTGSGSADETATAAKTTTGASAATASDAASAAVGVMVLATATAAHIFA